MSNLKLANQLKRIRGQIGGIERMLESGKSCEELLMQLSAAVSSLKSVSRELLAQEAADCNSDKKNMDYAKLLKRFF